MTKIIFLDVKNGIFDASKYHIEGYDVDQVELYRTELNPYLLKVFRRTDLLCRFSLGKWINTDKKYDYAVLPDGLITPSVIRYLGKHPIAKKQILYFWNMITQNEEPLLELAQKCGFTIMTYNKHDVDKYGLLYNSQVWDKSHLDDIYSSGQIKQDVYFTGYVKDRYNILCDIKNDLESRGISTRFNMVSRNGEEGTITNSISYSDYLNDCMESRAILDVVMKNNFGLTLRPLEALFMKKKLITNYTGIKEYDFYLPYKQNIFVWGEDDPSTLLDFLSSSFEEPTEAFDLDSYDIRSWVKRFCV